MKVVLKDHWMLINEGPLWKISDLEAAKGF